MCSKGQAAVNHTYDPDRILYPMRRVGERGSGQWKRISWDEALDEIAARMKKNRDAGTPEKVVYHYGRGKWSAQEMTWGGHYDNWDFDNTKFVLNFGSNFLETHTNHIPVAHRMLWAMADKGVEMVTFDVRLSNTAAKSREWVPVKVGTDLAVILAMINVVMAEGLYKGDGEEFLKYTRVTEDVNADVATKIKAIKAKYKEYTPKWAEKISGVPASKITALAREFATKKPAVLVSYRGLIAHYNGNEGERAAQLLCAITGQMDKPGTRMKAVGAGWKFPKIPNNAKKKLDIFDGFPGQAAYPTHHVSHQVLKHAGLRQRRRPGEHRHPQGREADPVLRVGRSVLRRLDHVRRPDPARHAVYRALDGRGHGLPGTGRRVLHPPAIHQANGRVVFDLAKRLGVDMGGASSHEEYVKMACEATPGVKEAGGFEYMKKVGVWHDKNAKPQQQVYNRPVPASVYQAKGVVLDKATGTYWKPANDAEAKQGYMATKKAFKKYVAQNMPHGVFSGFAPDALNKSGYLELWSPLLKAKGFDPMPTWMAVPEHQKMAKDDLHLTTFKYATHSHSRTMNCKYLAEVYHANPAWINPATAKDRGIFDGDNIKITIDRGDHARGRRGVAPLRSLGLRKVCV
jgi:anaerobic selenocysteine-containing dehydrogenase